MPYNYFCSLISAGKLLTLVSALSDGFGIDTGLIFLFNKSANLNNTK